MSCGSLLTGQDAEVQQAFRKRRVDLIDKVKLGLDPVAAQVDGLRCTVWQVTHGASVAIGASRGHGDAEFGFSARVPGVEDIAALALD